MDFSEMLTAVIFGNMLTVAALYGIWRLKHDDSFKSAAFLLAIFAVIGWIGWSAKPESTRQTYQSVIAGSGN